MALLTSELDLLRFELGWNGLTTGAEPYIGIAAIFDRVVAPYLRSGLITSSSTTVTAGAAPTPTTLVLAAASGTNTQGDAVSVHAGDRLVVDVDGQQELAVVESISGVNAKVILNLAHSGTYPVTVEGSESILRGLLRNCRNVSIKLESAASRVGIKKVDEIEFFGATSGGSTVFSELIGQRQYWRGELYRCLFGVGDRSLVGGGSGGGNGGLISVY